MPLLARLNPDRPPYLIVEIPLEPSVPQTSQAGQTLAEPVVKSA